MKHPVDIHNMYALAHSFILSTKTFLRTVCSPRYCVKNLKFLIPLFFGTPCTCKIILGVPVNGSMDEHASDAEIKGIETTIGQVF